MNIHNNPPASPSIPIAFCATGAPIALHAHHVVQAGHRPMVTVTRETLALMQTPLQRLNALIDQGWEFDDALHRVAPAGASAALTRQYDAQFSKGVRSC